MPFHEFTSVHGNRNARPYLSNGVLRNHAGINSQSRRGADSQSAASRLIGTRFCACPASVPMSRDAAGTSACVTGPVAKCEVIFACSLSKQLTETRDIPTSKPKKVALACCGGQSV